MAYAKKPKRTLLGYFSARFNCPIRVYPNGTPLTAVEHFLNIIRSKTICHKLFDLLRKDTVKYGNGFQGFQVLDTVTDTTDRA